MANPNLIGGGRLTRGEVSGDKRRFSNTQLDKGKLLRRLWKYLGRNRLLLVLAVVLSLSGSLLNLYGPKLSGKGNSQTVDCKFRSRISDAAWLSINTYHRRCVQDHAVATGNHAFTSSSGCVINPFYV